MAYFDEKQIKHIGEEAARRLGANATPMEVRNIVQQVLEKLDDVGRDESAASERSDQDTRTEEFDSKSSRVILTAFGKNHPGVISAITKVLADCSCDIQDMTQRLMQEFYSLMIIFDMGDSNSGFDLIREKLLAAGDSVGAKCLIQHEDIFKGMHRI